MAGQVSDSALRGYLTAISMDYGSRLTILAEFVLEIVNFAFEEKLRNPTLTRLIQTVLNVHNYSVLFTREWILDRTYEVLTEEIEEGFGRGWSVAKDCLGIICSLVRLEGRLLGTSLGKEVMGRIPSLYPFIELN